MLTQPACLAIFFCHFANNVGGYIVLAWLPTFISRTWDVPMNHVSMSFAPYACTAIAVNIGSYFADRCAAHAAYTICGCSDPYVAGFASPG